MDFEETYRLCVELTTKGELVGKEVMVRYKPEYLAIGHAFPLIEASDPFSAVAWFNKFEISPEILQDFEGAGTCLTMKSDKEIVEEDFVNRQLSYPWTYPHLERMYGTR